jgi:hypothetical protein
MDFVRVWQIPTLVFLWMIVGLHFGCALPGPTYHLMASKHALAAGTVIKDEDIEIGDVDCNRMLSDGYRTPPPPKEFTTERSRVIGHLVLRDIPPKRMINLADISQ